MLQSFRSAADSLPMKILLGVLLLSFIFWDMGGMFSGANYEDVATVGDASITQQQFDGAVQQELTRYSSMLGGDVPSLLRSAIEEDVESRLINSALLEEEAKAQGIVISDDVAAMEIRNNPAFSNGVGFSKEMFTAAITQAGFTEATYIAQVKKELSIQLLVDAVMSVVPDLSTQADLLHRYRNEQRTATTLTLPANYIADVPDPDEQTIMQYFSEHKARFSSPEYRRVQALVLSRMDVLNELDISDEVVAQYYQENSDSFRSPDRFTLRQITVPDFARLDKVQAALESGTTLAELNAEDDAIPATWTELTDTSATDLPPELISRISSVQEGEYSEPYSDAEGIHLYQLITRTPGGVESLDDVKGRITQELMEAQMDQVLYDRSIAVEDALAGGASLSEAAALGGVTVKTIGPIDMQGKQPDGSPSDNMPPIPSFMQEVFKLTEAEPPYLAQARNGVFYALKLDSVTDPRTRALDEVRGLVTQEWKTEEKARRVNQVAQGTFARLKQGESMADIASDMGLDAPHTVTVPRAEADPDPETGQPDSPLIPDLKDAIFELQPNRFTIPVKGDDDSWLIAHLDAIQPAPSATEDERTALLEELTRQYQMDMLEAYTAHLRTKHEVVINRKPAPISLSEAETSLLQ